MQIPTSALDSCPAFSLHPWLRPQRARAAKLAMRKFCGWGLEISDLFACLGQRRLPPLDVSFDLPVVRGERADEPRSVVTQRGRVHDVAEEKRLLGAGSGSTHYYMSVTGNAFHRWCTRLSPTSGHHLATVP